MGRRNRRPIFDIFVICSNLIVGGGGGVEQEVFFRASSNHIFCVPSFTFKDEWRRVSPRFHLVSDINQGNKEAR